MDEFMEDFLGYEGFGPPFAKREVPPEKIERFRGKLPDQLLKYWQEYGWCGYAKGLFWTVDPDEWEDELGAWIGDTPFMEQDTYYVIGRTAFGGLIIWGQKSGNSLEVVAPHGMIFPSDQTAKIASRGADRQIQLFFATSSKNNFELRDESGAPLFERALAALGPLDHDTLYGFVPALALGGKAELKNLQKLDSHVHLDILSQMTERQIMRDIGKDARDAGLM